MLFSMGWRVLGTLVLLLVSSTTWADELEEQIQDPGKLVERLRKEVEKLATISDEVALLKVIRDPVRVGPILRSYHQRTPWKFPKVRGLNESVQIGKQFVGARLELSDFSKRPIAFEIAQDRLLFDWESWVGHSEVAWESMGKKGKDEPSPFLTRVVLSRTTYFNYHFTDDRKWVSYHLQSPDGEYSLYGYVQAGSRRHTELEGLLNGRRQGKRLKKTAVTLRVAFPEGARRKQVEIKQIVTSGWVVSNEERERGLKEPE